MTSSTDLLDVNPNVQPIDWGSTSTQTNSEDKDTSEKSNVAILLKNYC